MHKISIVIPTVKYNEYLDSAIESCFTISHIEVEIIVSINGLTSEGFEKSKFYNNPLVVWKCSNKKTAPMHESINNAIGYATSDWLFILSDDDIILDGFLKNIDLKGFLDTNLYSTRINIIDETGKVISETPNYNKSYYEKEEALNLFFTQQLHHHISLFVFHKDMYKKCGPFSFTGYKNGYYIDTVFHGKIIANCNKIYASSNIVFSRRETSTQGSAKFYFNKEVNEYFNIIVEAFFKDDCFQYEALKRYGSKKAFYRKMLQYRFFTEYSKLNMKTYNQKASKKIEFLIKQLYWNTGLKFKLLSFLYAFKMEMFPSIPVKNIFLKLIRRIDAK